MFFVYKLLFGMKPTIQKICWDICHLAQNGHACSLFGVSSPTPSVFFILIIIMNVVLAI